MSLEDAIKMPMKASRLSTLMSGHKRMLRSCGRRRFFEETADDPEGRIEQNGDERQHEPGDQRDLGEASHVGCGGWSHR